MIVMDQLGVELMIVNLLEHTLTSPNCEPQKKRLTTACIDSGSRLRSTKDADAASSTEGSIIEETFSVEESQPLVEETEEEVV